MDALAIRGHQVKAFNSAKFGEGVAEKFQPIMDEKVIHVECWNKIDRLLFFPRQWKIEKKLKYSYDLTQFDLLHSQLLLSSGYSALRMKRKYGIPYVLSVRVTDLTGFIKLPYFQKMALNIVKHANGVLFLSKCHKEEFVTRFLPQNEKEEFFRKSVVIGNSLEKFWAEHTAEPRKEKVNVQKLRILTVAKIRPIKNLSIAAEAVEALRERGFGATLTVIGENQDPIEYEKLKQYSCVQVLDFMKKGDLLNAYRAHDIFLLPSKNETFGRVYVEAMSQGLPILYTIRQGFDKAFPDGQVGYSIPCDSPQTIADRIEDIIQNYTEMSAQCIKGSKMYHEDHITNQVEKFYRQALQQEGE